MKFYAYSGETETRKGYLWTDSTEGCVEVSTLFINNTPIAFISEKDGYYYGICYVFDDLDIGVLGARNLNYAKNEVLNKIRKYTQAKIHEYKELKSKLKKIR